MDVTDVEAVRFVRLLSAPQQPEHDDARQRFVPALVSAHAAGGPIVLGWLNRLLAARDRRFALVAGGTGGERAFPFTTSAGADGPPRAMSCLFPPGGRAEPLAGAAVLDAVRSLPAWTVLAAEPAPPGGPQQPPAGQQPSSGGAAREGSAPAAAPAPHRPAPGRLGLEDVGAHLADIPFAWLLVAVPISPDTARSWFRSVQSAARGMANAARSPGEQALDLAVANAVLEELHRGRSIGLWNVRWLAGSSTGARVQELAALLAAVSALQQQPLRLVPTTEVHRFDEALKVEEAPPAWQEPRVPFVSTSEHLATLGRTPSREIPGFRLTLPQDFDLNTESLPSPAPAAGASSAPGASGARSRLSLGVVLDQWSRPGGAFDVSFDALNRHMFVCGATGSGKSQTVRQLLEELSRHHVPWLVIEPVKAEYRRMADRLAPAGAAVDVIRLGAADEPPCMLNPLEPERGFNLQTHVDMVTALFLASFEADEPFPQVLSESLRRCYETLGWDLATGRFKAARHGPAAAGQAPPGHPTYPTLAELQAVADEVVQGVGYGPEVQANVRGFMKVRLSSLRLGTPGRFFEAGHPLDVARLLDSNVVLELEDVGNDQDKAFVIGAVLLRVVEHLRVNRPQTDELQHVTVIEEAHRLLRRPDRSGPASHAIEAFAGLLAEVRAYGEGLVIAEQIPTKIVPDVVKNTAVQVMHRLPAQDDRELVGRAMNMTPDQMGYVVGIGRGEAAVFTEGMDRPVLVAMRLGKDREGEGRGARNAAGLLLGRRSPACPPLCWDAPCTVTDMQAAAQWAATIPDPDLYVELLTLNLLRPDGPALLPADDLAATLRPGPGRRERECALGQLAQSAIQRRRAVLAEYCDPQGPLAALVAFLTTVVGDAASPSLSWVDLAGPWRLPDSLPEPQRLAAYLGGDADGIGSWSGEVGRDPLLALARDCQKRSPDHPGASLGIRIAEIVAPQGPTATDFDLPSDLTHFLAWCFNWADPT